MLSAGVQCARKRVMSKPARSEARERRSASMPTRLSRMRRRTSSQRCAKRIENRAIDLRRAEIGDQRIEAVCGARPRSARHSGRRNGRTPCAALPSRYSVGGDAQRKPQLIEIVLVREREVLVEPFGRQQFGGRPPNANRHRAVRCERGRTLRRLRQRDHAEAERHPQAHVSLIKTHLTNDQPRRVHVGIPVVLRQAERSPRTATGLQCKCNKFAEIFPVICLLPFVAIMLLVRPIPARNRALPENFARVDLTR